MNDHADLRDMVAAEEDALLVDGENYEFDVDFVELKESKAGRKFLKLSLVVVEGAKEGTEVEELLFWPTGPEDKGYTFFKRKLHAFGLSIPTLIDNGVTGVEQLDVLAEVLEGLPVSGKATVKEAFNSPGDKENGVWLNRSERLDVDTQISFK